MCLGFLTSQRARSLLLEQLDWDGSFTKSAGSSLGVKSLGSRG